MQFKGEDVTKLSADVTTHRGISLMPGGKGVFPTLTVAENLRLASWLIRKDKDRIVTAQLNDTVRATRESVGVTNSLTVGQVQDIAQHVQDSLG